MFLLEKASEIIVLSSSEESSLISEEFTHMGFEGVIQVVCDSKKKIRDVLIGYPGSVHDVRVFRNSPLANTLGQKCHNFFLLGDSACPCLGHLLTPCGNLSNAQKNFNKKLNHCRVLIEDTMGLLKQRFRQLHHLKLRML
nr:unnamed protein product [Callosobruchus analis]